MDFVAPETPLQITTAQLASDVRAALAASYAHPIVVVQVDCVAVLDGKPLELARTTISETHGAATAERVQALDVAALPWHAIPAGGLRVWRQHGRANADGELVTELEAGDPPVQVIVDEAGWRLVRLADGAQGWIAPSVGTLESSDAPSATVRDVARVDVTRFVGELTTFEGAPYVWGGTTDAGVDCSGLVQRAAWRAGGCWLPRHSRALLGVGQRVAPSAVARGDILVLQRDPSTYADEQRAQLEALSSEEQRTGRIPTHGPAIHPMHVAVALSAEETIHASRDSMRVNRESLATLRERYRVLGVRRLGESAVD